MDYKEEIKKNQLEIMDDIAAFCERKKLDYFLIGGSLLGCIRHSGFIPWDDDLDIAMPRKDYEIFIKTYRNHGKFQLDCYDTNKKYWLSFAKVRNINTEYVEKLQRKYDGPKGIWVDIFPLDYSRKASGIKHSIRFKSQYILKGVIARKSKIDYGDSSISSKVAKNILAVFPKLFFVKIQKKIMDCESEKNAKYFINLGSKYGPIKQTHEMSQYYPIKKAKFEDRIYNIPNNYKYILEKIYGKTYMQIPPIDKQITHNPIKIRFENGEELFFK